jgi:hypothetical protein
MSARPVARLTTPEPRPALRIYVPLPYIGAGRIERPRGPHQDFPPGRRAAREIAARPSPPIHGTVITGRLRGWQGPGT